MSLDTWIVVDAASWDAIDPDRLISVDIVETDEEGNQQVVGSYLTKAVTEVEPWHRVYRSGVTGYWSQSVYNVIGSQEDIAALLAELPAATIAGQWIQGRGQPEIDNDPATVIAAQPDIVEYDEDGNQTGSRRPTISDQNEAHRFLGQNQRRAARAFSKGFGRGFA